MFDSLSVDLYAENLKLKYHFSLQENYQKVFGATVYNLWVLMAALEKNRIQMNKKLMGEFIEKHKEVNGNGESLSACLSQLASMDAGQEYHEAWDVENVLSQDDQAEVRRQIKKEGRL